MDKGSGRRTTILPKRKLWREGTSFYGRRSKLQLAILGNAIVDPVTLAAVAALFVLAAPLDGDPFTVGHMHHWAFLCHQ
jgi:hypothetical protein